MEKVGLTQELGSAAKSLEKMALGIRAGDAETLYDRARDNYLRQPRGLSIPLSDST